MNTWTYNGAVKKYGYAYDALNRMTTSTLYDVNNQSSTTFAETFTFDKMGNVTYLGRTGSSTQIDGLTLTYNGNQLKQVDDAGGSRNLYDIKEYTSRNTSGDDFAYDANGNMVKDLDRNIVAFQYNVLNLPDVIQFRNGNQIKNTYDAGGHKLGTEYFTQLTNITPLADGQIISQSYNSGVVDQTGNAYIGNMEYKTQNGNSSLTAISRIYNDEGYVETPGNPQYYYYRRDHLGDNREVWLANTGETVQRTQYYPSGLPWAYNSGDNPGKQQRKYNGKEFVEMHGYDTYDIVWRQYYPAIMRFQTVDPLAEKYYSISPYAYCAGNPIKYIDVNGKAPGDFFLTMNAAAGDFGKTYNDNSIREGHEYGSKIYMITNSDGKSGYTYTVPAIGEGGSSVTPSDAPMRAYVTGYTHTHGEHTTDHYDNNFSGSINYEKTNDPLKPVLNTAEENKSSTTGDVGFSNKNNLTGYVATPNGSLQKYDPTTGKTSTISTQMPSDPNDPTKLNNNNAGVEKNPVVIPKSPELYTPSPIERKTGNLIGN